MCILIKNAINHKFKKLSKIGKKFIFFLLISLSTYIYFANLYNTLPGNKFISHISEGVIIYKIKLNNNSINLSNIIYSNPEISWLEGNVAVKNSLGNIVYIESLQHDSKAHGSFYISASDWNFLYIRVPLWVYKNKDSNKYLDLSSLDNDFDSFYKYNSIILDKYLIRIPTFIILEIMKITNIYTHTYEVLIANIIFFIILFSLSSNLLILLSLISITFFIKSLSHSAIIFIIIYIFSDGLFKIRTFFNLRI